MLEDIESFVNRTCPNCGSHAAKAETDTLDTFVDSSFYFLRFVDPFNLKELVSKEKFKRMMPVDEYVGGMEHAIMHLLYARFIHKFLAREMEMDSDFQSDSTQRHETQEELVNEPFKKLITQGLVKGKTYHILTPTGAKKYLTTQSERDSHPEEQINVTFEKMSKSKGNGVQPIQVIEEEGSDVLRLALFFSGPSESDILWEGSLLQTMKSFLRRIIRLVQEPNGLVEEKNQMTKGEAIQRTLRFLKEAKDAIQRRSFHVAVARSMEAVYQLEDMSPSKEKDIFLCCFLILFYPLAPFSSSFLWETAKGLEEGKMALESNGIARISASMFLQESFSLEKLEALFPKQSNYTLYVSQLPIEKSAWTLGESRSTTKT